MAQEAGDLGIRGVEIFGIPTYKDEQGSSCWDRGATGEQQAIKAIRKSGAKSIGHCRRMLMSIYPVGHCGMIDHHE